VLGLDCIDSTARNSNLFMGRWLNLDPLTENFCSYSYYNYAINNPIYFIDPDGSLRCGNGGDEPTLYNVSSVAAGNDVINQLDEIVISIKRDKGTVVSIHVEGIKLWSSGSDAESGSDDIKAIEVLVLSTHLNIPLMSHVILYIILQN